MNWFGKQDRLELVAMITASPYKRLMAYLSQQLAEGGGSFDAAPAPYHRSLAADDARNFMCHRMTLPHPTAGNVQLLLPGTVPPEQIVVVRMDGDMVEWFEVTAPDGGVHRVRLDSEFHEEIAALLDEILSGRGL